MKTEIGTIIHKAIEDFDSKWQSHEDRVAGITEYAEEILRLFDDTEPRKTLFKFARFVMPNVFTDFALYNIVSQFLKK